MGRTNPTFRNLLEAVEDRWGAYRRALRRRDRPHFDRLFADADSHADAAGYLNADDAMDPILFSMLLEQQKRIAALDRRLARLESSAPSDPDSGSRVKLDDGAEFDGVVGFDDGFEAEPSPDVESDRRGSR